MKIRSLNLENGLQSEEFFQVNLFNGYIGIRYFNHWKSSAGRKVFQTFKGL